MSYRASFTVEWSLSCRWFWLILQHGSMHLITRTRMNTHTMYVLGLPTSVYGYIEGNRSVDDCLSGQSDSREEEHKDDKNAYAKKKEAEAEQEGDAEDQEEEEDGEHA